MPSPLDMPVYLRARQLLRVEEGAGLEVRCLQGELWITQEGDQQDRLIRAGESLVLDRDGLSLVTALGEPALLIVQPGKVDALRLAA